MMVTVMMTVICHGAWVASSALTLKQNQKWQTVVGYLVLSGWLRLLHHVPIGEGGDRGGVSGLLGATRTVDLGEDQLLQACRGRQTAMGVSQLSAAMRQQNNPSTAADLCFLSLQASRRGLRRCCGWAGLD